nr:hypothetical protein [Mesorhizobium sp.]
MFIGLLQGALAHRFQFDRSHFLTKGSLVNQPLPIHANQSHARADRDKGKLLLAGEDASGHRAGGRTPSAVCMWVTGEATSTSSIAPRETLVPASSCGCRRTGWPSGLPVLPHTIDQDETTWLQMKFAAINTLRRWASTKRYSPQVLTYMHAPEENPPPGREPIDWKLVTNLPVEDLSVAVEKLGWRMVGRQRGLPLLEKAGRAQLLLAGDIGGADASGQFAADGVASCRAGLENVRPARIRRPSTG